MGAMTLDTSIINKRSPVLRSNITQVISSFIYFKKKKRDLTRKISIMCVYIYTYMSRDSYRRYPIYIYIHIY